MKPIQRAANSAQSPYSPALRAGDWLFVSGQIATRADGSMLGDADLATQARQCLIQLRAVLEAGGATLDQVAKVTVYLATFEGLGEFNRIYAEFFGTHRPARSLVPVAAFPGGILVEIEAIALLADAGPDLRMP